MKLGFTAAIVAAAAAAGRADKIDTVVVLMMENRAFDHMLGFMSRGGPNGDTRVDGLDGTECNSRDILAKGACTTEPRDAAVCGASTVSGGKPSDPSVVCVTDQALDNCPYDPNHAHGPTTERIFGCRYCSSTTPSSCPGVANGSVAATSPCVEHASLDGTPIMTGFTQSSVWEKHDGENEMTMWPPEKVPIITTLAKEFANFDRFFCSHPGPTYPNRQFVHSGTAHGETDDEVPKAGFPQKTIYRQLEESGKTWNMFYEDSLAWAIFLDDLRRNESKANLNLMGDFYGKAANGTLPSYSFIEPRIAAAKERTTDPSFGLANHQHPTASVREGERLMKNVYEALRKGPKWNSTLYIITYDEHGGFFDHVPPPQEGVPNPDGIETALGFNFTRLGIRIPTIAISPWIESGTLVHTPPASQQPTPTSQWELSSIPATVAKILNLQGPPLTKRTEWAATFEHLLSRDTPRTDCPLELPVIPPPADGEWERQQTLPIDEHARGVIKMLCDMNGGDPLGKTGGVLGEAALEAEAKHCDELGICLSGRHGCGAGIETNAQFSAFRERMWQHWMQK